MAKVKYDYDGVENSFYSGDDPVPGIYNARVKSCEMGTSKASNNPMITAIIEITDGTYKGWGGFHRLVQTEESLWKTKEFTDALGLTQPGKKRGTWDTDDAVGKKCRIKIKRRMYEGEPTADIKSVLKAKDADDDEGDDEPVTDDETPTTDEPDEEPEGDEPEGEEGDDEGDDDARAEREAELAGMNRVALKMALAAVESDLKVVKSTTDDAIREAILAAEFPDEEDEEEDDEPEGDDEDVWTWADLVDLDRAALKKVITDEELGIKVTKAMTDDALRAAVAAALEVEVDGEPPF